MVDGLGMARSQLEQHVICEALALRLEVRGLCERELVILFLYDSLYGREGVHRRHFGGGLAQLELPACG